MRSAPPKPPRRYVAIRYQPERPNVFSRPATTFDLSVTIANNIKGSGPDCAGRLFLSTTDGLEIFQKPSALVPISEGKDTSVHWLLRAKDLLGQCRHYRHRTSRRARRRASFRT